ncbi:MAG: HD domain-containing protein [Coriobacteriia bacterium]|nr:HD domain-containing protein [Coriobacteriia bacterium]
MEGRTDEGSVRSRTVSSYRGGKRISVEYLAPVSEYDPADLIESSHRENDEVITEFNAVAAAVRDRVLRRILKAVFGDRGFFSTFAACPGARAHHHAYLGGLIEHTLAVAALCRTLGPMYAGVDTNLLVTAVLPHDIGKVDELTYDTAVGYTDEDRLLGHVVLSERRLREASASLSPAPSRELLTRLSHAVLSHHGELEWGSPKRPSTLPLPLQRSSDRYPTQRRRATWFAREPSSWRCSTIMR